MYPVGTIPSAPIIPTIVFIAAVNENDTSNPLFNFLETAIEKVELISAYKIIRTFIRSRRVYYSTALIGVK